MSFCVSFSRNFLVTWIYTSLVTALSPCRSLRANGFEQYQFHALGSACHECRAINEKVFDVKDMMPGENAPPLHPRCRCSVSAYMDSAEYNAWLKGLDEHGLTFKEWRAEQEIQKTQQQFTTETKAVRKSVFGRARFKSGDEDSKGYVDSKRPLANFRATPREKVVNLLRRDSKEWIDGLTDKERHAIRKNTYNSGDKKPNRFFERLNAMLRGIFQRTRD